MTVLETTLVAARDRKRLGEIASVVLRFGVDDLARRMGLAALLPRCAGARGPEAESLAPPERLRRALEALGPTFIKLGQILSTRADLLGPEWIAALEKLQSGAPSLPWEDIAAEVEEALGGAPQALFAAFETAPMAAGSIAQVHRARLADGSDVAVKLRRPGIRPLVEADLRLLAHAAGIVEREWPDIARYRPREILRHLGAAMAEEMDLAAEGRNCEAIAANLADAPDILIPKIHWEWTSERVLVQEFVPGLTPVDPAALAAAGLDAALLARRGAHAFLHMALVDGLFHADPHPGNLRALPGDRIGFIDFGMVGRIGVRRREQLLALIGAMVRGDAASLSAIMLVWAGAEDVDAAGLEAACDSFLARRVAGGGTLALGEALGDFMAIARDHRVALPGDLALLFKALVTADGVLRRIDPGFDIIDAATPLVRDEMQRRLAPAALARRGQDVAGALAGLAADAPEIVRLLALRLRQGRVGARVELEGLDRIGGDLRWAAARIAVALVVAAFALGLAPYLLAAGPELFGLRVTALLGAAVAVAGAVWLALPRRR